MTAPVAKVSAPLWAVVPAAGSGSRFGGERPKQYQRLHGKAVIEHSLARLLDITSLRRVVVALSADDGYFHTLPIAVDARVAAVQGGGERAESVRLALASLADSAADEDWVLVHDAARPCVSTADIQQLLAQGCGHPVGALLAAPVVDTLKRGSHNEVIQTVERGQLWRALTPQLFRYGPLCRALDACKAKAMAVTDEAFAMEQQGQRPLLVDGQSRNIKITYADDLALAEFYLRDRQ